MTELIPQEVLMRSFNRAAAGVAVIAGSTLVGATASAGTVPPDDEDAVALEQFTELAERSGYTLVDPACSASPDGGDVSFTCYAMTTSGGPFIARTTLSGADVVEFEILAQPGEPSEATTPVEGSSEDAGGFDPLAYFDALFSADAEQISTLQSMTATGSPAEAYALYQLAFAQSIDTFGGEVDPSHVYLTEDGVLVCVLPQTCVYAADLEVIDGQLADFTVDGEEIAPRLGRPGQPITVGPTSARVQAAYRAVTGNDALRIYVELSSSSDATFEMSNAVYVDADDNVVPVDRETSIGAIDGTARDPVSLALDFPRADPGGELRFLVFPRGADAPLAVVLPVEPVVSEPVPTTTIE